MADYRLTLPIVIVNILRLVTSGKNINLQILFTLNVFACESVRDIDIIET